MVTKETFIKIIKLIQEQDKIDEEISNALEKICGSWVLFGTEHKVKRALFLLLNATINDEFDTISWWLYENVEKFIYDKEGNIIENLTSVDALYAYLIKNIQIINNEVK